jgi:hypothetical protein
MGVTNCNEWIDSQRGGTAYCSVRVTDGRICVTPFAVFTTPEPGEDHHCPGVVTPSRESVENRPGAVSYGGRGTAESAARQTQTPGDEVAGRSPTYFAPPSEIPQPPSQETK